MKPDPSLMASNGKVYFSRRASWLILGLIALLYIGTCFTPVIFDDNEGLYAGAVREMHARGDWLTPWSNGFPRVQKPPLVYWTMLVSTAVLGENEFAIRLPNALATIGWIVATYLIARRFGERFGIATAVILASMMGVWIFNHLVQPEPFMACFISLSLWCLVEARLQVGETSDPKWSWLFWTFLALGTMSKGLHGALWPLGVAGLTALFVPGWRPYLRPIFTWKGVLLFAAILAPWYIYMAVRWPGFLSAHFVNEQIGASLNRRFPTDAKQLPMLQFYAQHLLFWMPWTLMIPGGLAVWFQARNENTEASLFTSTAQKDLVSLLGIWVALTMISVVFSTRQDYYSMSCWGVMAMAFAVPWIAADRGTSLPRAYLAGPCLLMALAGLAALGLAAWVYPKLNQLGASTAAPIQSRDTFFDAISGISPALWAHFIVLLVIFGAAMLVAGAAATLFAWKRRALTSLFWLSGAMAVPLCLAAVGFTIMSPYFSLAENAWAINREIESEPEAIVACEGPPNTASSLFYYLNARVHWVNAPFDNQYAQQVLGLGRDYYWDEKAIGEKWATSPKLYFIVEESRLAYWQALLPNSRVLQKSGTRVVLVNR